MGPNRAVKKTAPRFSVKRILLNPQEKAYKSDKIPNNKICHNLKNLKFK